MAGPSVSKETSPATAGASAPSGATSVVCEADAHTADDTLASSEAVAASADHNSSSALNDSLDAGQDEFGSCQSLLDPTPVAGPSEVKKSVKPISKKPPASQQATRSGLVQRTKKPGVPARPQTSTTLATQSKAKSSTPQKTDKNLKRLSRDSPLAGRKSW